VLDEIVTEYADDLGTRLRRPRPGDTDPVPLNLALIIAFTNGRLEVMSNPDREPAPSPYAGYSDDRG
jgi:hypothetical protein